MAAFSKIKPGMILWDYHKYKMGNTTMTQEGEWELEVISVDPINRMALCSWNGNPSTWYSERRLLKYRVNRKAKK